MNSGLPTKLPESQVVGWRGKNLLRSRPRGKINNNDCLSIWRDAHGRYKHSRTTRLDTLQRNRVLTDMLNVTVFITPGKTVTAAERRQGATETQ